MKRSLFGELKRRNVLRAAALYVAATWALAQGIAQLTPVVGAPDWIARWFLVAAAIGFPLWIAFAWFYRFTPEGLKRESEIEPVESITHGTGRKLDFAIIAVLALAVVLLLTDRFVLRHGVNAQSDVPVSSQSIAVLPFVDMSQGKDQEYFSDGISEELLNLLAKIPQLRVIARTSSFSFKGKEADIATIAKALNVAHVLEGSIRKSGNRVRITAQLIRTADSSRLWSETYDRDLSDIFAVQDEISAAVVAQLKLKLLGAAPKARATDPRAYALFLQGQQLDRQHTTDGFTQAIALLQQALAIDPAYPAAWIELGSVYINQADVGSRPITEGYTLGREATNKALALDPDFAPAHAGLGYIAMTYDGDLAAAAQHFKRALVLAPEDTSVLHHALGLAASLGRLDSAIAIGEGMIARDPASAGRHFELGTCYLVAGRPDAAIASLRTALALSPGYTAAHLNIGEALLTKGQPLAALAEMQQEPNENFRMIGLAIAWHALGKKAEADAALTELIRKYEKESAYNIAYVYAYRGEADRAFEWLDKAVAYHDVGLFLIPTEPLFANIRKDPRWLPFLRKIGKAPEQLAKIEFKVTLPAEWQAEAAHAAAKAATATPASASTKAPGSR